MLTASDVAVEVDQRRSQTPLTDARLTRGGVIEAIACGTIIFITSLIHSSGKLIYSEDASGSLPLQLFLLGTFVFAGVRLLKIPTWPARFLREARALWVFLAITLVSCVWSLDPLPTLKSAIELIGTTLVAAYFVARFTLPQFLNILAWMYAVMASASALLVVGSPSRGKMDWGAGAFDGLFAEKNGLGAAMSLAIITLVLLVLSSRGRQRWLCAALLPVCLFLLVGSNSITALVVLLGVTMVCLVMWGIRSRRYTEMFVVATCVFGAMVVVFGALGFEPGQIFDLFGRNANLTGRTEMWPELIGAVKDRPLLGYGYNAFFQDEALETDYLSNFVGTYNWLPPHAHDSYIQIALDTGLIGLTSFFVAFVMSVTRSIRYFVLEPNLLVLWPFAVIAFQALGSYDETYFAQASSLQWMLFVGAVLYPIRGVR